MFCSLILLWLKQDLQYISKYILLDILVLLVHFLKFQLHLLFGREEYSRFQKMPFLQWLSWYICNHFLLPHLKDQKKILTASNTTTLKRYTQCPHYFPVVVLPLETASSESKIQAAAGKDKIRQAPQTSPWLRS